MSNNPLQRMSSGKPVETGFVNSALKKEKVFPRTPQVAQMPTEDDIHVEPGPVELLNSLLPKDNPPILDPEAPEETPEVKPIDSYLSDVSLEQFYLTGRLEYDFKFLGKVPVKLRTLSSAELMESNQFLFNSSNDARAYSVVMQEHAQMVLSHALMQYGQMDLSKKTPAERLAFITELPSPIMSKIAQKYSQFENTAIKLINDADALKN